MTHRHWRFFRIWLFVCAVAYAPSVVNACEANTRCVFVIGNSITIHGPAPEIGWSGNWGMAASTKENDFVSKLTKALQRDSAPGGWTSSRAGAVALESNPATFKPPQAFKSQARKADLVVVALGDNFDLIKEDIAVFAKAYVDFLVTLKTQKNVVVCVGTWWSNSKKDMAIRDSCAKVNGVYADLSGLSAFDENSAKNQPNLTHAGVAIHPGDIGMDQIAKRIFEALSGSRELDAFR